MINKILRLIVNTLTVDDYHYLLNRENSKQPIQVQLSKKLKAFSEFSFEFLNPISIFKLLQNKNDPHSSCISGNNCPEKHG